MEKQKITISDNLDQALAGAIAECAPDRIFVLAAGGKLPRGQ